MKFILTASSSALRIPSVKPTTKSRPQGLDDISAIHLIKRTNVQNKFKGVTTMSKITLNATTIDLISALSLDDIKLL